LVKPIQLITNMKILKNLFIIATVFAFLISITSCKKCIICIIKNIVGDTTVFISPEQCGSSSKLSDYQNALTAAYSCQTCWHRDSLNGANDTTTVIFNRGKQMCGSIRQLDSIKGIWLVGIIQQFRSDTSQHKRDTLICIQSQNVVVNCNN